MLTPTIEAPLEQRIRHGAYATVVVVVATHLLRFLTDIPPFEWRALLDLPILIGLAYGLYRKSRIAAIGLVIYFIAVGAVQFLRWHTLPMAVYIILAFFLGRAIPAVFRYHKLASQSASSGHAA